MRRHPTRWSALVFGLIFLCVIASRLMWQFDIWPAEIANARMWGVTGAIILIVLGAIGIIVTVVRDRNYQKENHDQTSDPQP